MNVLSSAMRPENTASRGTLLREGSTKGDPVRTSSRFSCNHVLLRRHMADLSPPTTHNLESSSKSANVLRCSWSNTWVGLVRAIDELHPITNLRPVAELRGEVCFASEKATDSDPMSLCALMESVCDQKLAEPLGAVTMQCVLGRPHNVGDLKSKIEVCDVELTNESRACGPAAFF